MAETKEISGIPMKNLNNQPLTRQEYLALAKFYREQADALQAKAEATPEHQAALKVQEALKLVDQLDHEVTSQFTKSLVYALSGKLNTVMNTLLNPKKENE